MEISVEYVSRMMNFSKSKLDDVTDDWKKSLVANGEWDTKTLELGRSVKYWEGRVYTWQLVLADRKSVV